MAAREDFLTDYRIGDKVTVVLGPGLVWTGILSEMGDNRLKLRMDDGTVRSVGYGAVLADFAPVGQAGLRERDMQMVREAARRVEEAVYVWRFDPDSLREAVRLSPNVSDKRMISALCDELASAAEAEDYDTLDRIIVAAESLSERNAGNAVVRRLAGEAALLAGDYEAAEELLYAGGNYKEAFYAASLIPSDDRMAEDGACHLLYEKKKQPDVVECFVRLAEAAGDLSVFRRFVEDEGREYPELAVRCLCYLAMRKDAVPELGRDGLYSSFGRAALLRSFRENYPDPENSQLEQMEQVEPPQEAAGPDAAPAAEGTFLNGRSIPAEELPAGLEGVVFSFKPEHKIGFIRANGVDWFFHINHVSDDNLARMLEEDPDGRYLVTFDVGYNSRGRCAMSVHLTDPANPKEAPDPLLSYPHHGYLSRYFPYYQNGQLTEQTDEGEVSYNFRLAYVSDPELKNACETHADIALERLPVVFWLKMLKDGKLVASDVKLDREAMGAPADRGTEAGSIFPG